MTAIRKAAVANMFYPGNAAALRAEVRQFLDAAGSPDGPAPKAIVAPHAGYRYSGAIAAKAYALLKPVADKITRVVLLGPCHRVAVQGLALSGADYFETPLGRVEIDKEAEESIRHFDQVGDFDVRGIEAELQRLHLDERAARGLVGPQLGLPLGEDCAGHDAVHPDPRRPELARQRRVARHAAVTRWCWRCG